MDTVENQSLDQALRYLDRIGISDREQQLRIALELLARARKRGDGSSATSVLFGHADEWFAAAFATAPDPTMMARGVAMLQAGRADISTFPFEKPTSDLSASKITHTPDLAVSNMTSEDIDFGAMEAVANETWHKFAWGPILRAAAIWTAIFFGSLALYEKLLGQ